MAKYKQVGGIFKKEDEGGWVVWLIAGVVVLALMASCG